MTHEHLLRPARLFQKFPEARTAVAKIRATLDDSNWPSDQGTDAAMRSMVEAFNKRISALPDERSWPLYSPSGLYHALNEAIWVARLEESGRQSFLLTDAVRDELRLSNVGDLRVADLRMPFSAIYIGLETPLELNAIIFEGAYVAKCGNALIVAMSLLETEDVHPAWFIERPYVVELSDPDALIRASIGVQVERAAADAQRARIEMESIGEAGFPAENISAASDAYAEKLAALGDPLRVCLDLTANILCLLTAMPADMIGDVEWFPPRPKLEARSRSAAKRERLAALQAGNLEVRRLTFGRSAPLTGSGNATDRIGPRAHWRRGHWRRQQVGPASERTFKPVWIRPTLVNPDRGGAAEESIYDVKTSVGS